MPHAQKAEKALARASRSARKATTEAGKAVSNISEAGREAAEEAKERVGARARQAREGLEEAGSSARKRLEQRREELRDHYDTLAGSTASLAEDCGDFVRRRPMTSLLVAATVGCLTGCLLERRRAQGAGS